MPETGKPDAPRQIARNSWRVTLNGRTTLVVPGGVPLIEALAGHQVFVPSACGGRGACGYCRAKVPAAPAPFTRAELALLTEDERRAGVRLSCQVIVGSDLAVELPEKVLAARAYRARVARIRPLAYDVRELLLELLAPREIRFAPGQYVQLLVPGHEDAPVPVHRAYSISSPPGRAGAIELIIRLVHGGLCTTWVFTRLKEGDEVRLSGPYGDFGLSDSGRDMLWIAGGSGMAPFWSMARHMAETNDRRNCTYFFGAVARRDLFLVDELRALERRFPRFRFIPALSKPDPADAWTGETGLITQVVDHHVAGGTDAEAYLCGGAGMIAAALKVLAAKGITKDRIFYDRFT